MIEQQHAQKKQRVGSLFFHLFHRLSLWVYTVLCNCFPARLLTSYEVLELRWSRIYTWVIGTPDTKLRKNIHAARLHFAKVIENSKPLIAADKVVRFFIYCPLNVYGIFFLIYGAMSAAVYFISTRLEVTYAGNIGWGIAGIVIAVFSLPLLCSSKPLYRAAFGSRIVGKILRSYMGLEMVRKGQEKRERGNTVLVYAALLLGVVAGISTYLYHPATIPLVILVVFAFVTVLYIPEAGVLLGVATFPYWWITGNAALCAVAVCAVTQISFLNKLVRGKRVLHIRLLDFAVLLLCFVFASHGIFTSGGLTSLYYGIGYTVLIAMYFPTVSLMQSKEWLDRCYRLLTISGTVLSIISILPFTQIVGFLDMILARVDFSMMSGLIKNYDAYFGQNTLVCGMLLMLLPIMLSGFVGKRSITGFFWKALWVVVGCLSVLITMQIGAWAGLGVTLLLFFFMYSYRALSATMLLAFPAACGVVWYQELDTLFNWRTWEIVQATLDMVVSYCDGAANRFEIARSVLNMSKDHMLGVGLGEHAVQAVFPYYAAAGMESVTDMQNAYLQLLAECGYLSVLMFGVVLLLFAMSVLTYLRYGTNQGTKSRVVAGISGVGGVLVMGLTCDFFGSATVFGLFWLVIAVTAATLRTQYESLERAVLTHSPTGERSDVAFRIR